MYQGRVKGPSSILNPECADTMVKRTVPDLPQGQLGPGPGPEIQGGPKSWKQNGKEKKKKERKKKVGKPTIALVFLVMFADLIKVCFVYIWSGKHFHDIEQI